MTLRDALLALIGNEPKYGYQLKLEFEAACGGMWQVNPGQIYTTLQRLERDGLVQTAADTDEDHVAYERTSAGSLEADQWLATPVESPVSDRDEMTMRILIALATESQPPFHTLDAQRATTLSNLAALTGQRDATTANDDVVTRLQLDRLILLHQAEIRWLERVEDELHRRQNENGTQA